MSMHSVHGGDVARLLERFLDSVRRRELGRGSAFRLCDPWGWARRILDPPGAPGGRDWKPRCWSRLDRDITWASAGVRKRVGSLRRPKWFSSRSHHCPPIGKTNWQEARARLFGLKREIDNVLRAVEDVRQLCLQTPATTSGGRRQPCDLGGAATDAGCECQPVPSWSRRLESWVPPAPQRWTPERTVRAGYSPKSDEKLQIWVCCCVIFCTSAVVLARWPAADWTIYWLVVF